MTTPAPLAAKAVTSRSFAAARQRVLNSYRSWQRSAPTIVEHYQLDIPASAVRAKIREEFEKNRYVNDLPIINILLFKSDTEYQETMNMWKMESQLMSYFSAEEAPPKPKGFLERFYAGRD